MLARHEQASHEGDAHEKSHKGTARAQLIRPLINYQKGVRGPCTRCLGCAKLEILLQVLREYNISGFLAGV